ncbi:DUF2809 domain-containing protein [Solwaraspora sp. WMMB335]|uniref:ribosomal maturation YjgA family protein n=1 Tax=Solwaraspora sp. WMMB335 TaxID=3404118 RepID=UPI003B94AAFE
MAVQGWRVRLAGLAAAGGFLATALGIRVLTQGDGVLDSSGALRQHSGTALYASMVYAGVFVLAPRARPVVAGTLAVAFCWLVELLQLTGLPAELSGRSLAARLVLGVRFDAADLVWYPVGVLPLVLIHAGVVRWRSHEAGSPSSRTI